MTETPGSGAILATFDAHHYLNLLSNCIDVVLAPYVVTEIRLGRANFRAVLSREARFLAGTEAPGRMAVSSTGDRGKIARGRVRRL